MATCAGCGAEIADGGAVLLQGKGKKAPITSMCPACAAAMDRVLEAETQSPNLLGGFLGGLGAGVVGCLVWYGVVILTNYQLAVLAIGVGWLVAHGVMFGAGRKRGPRLQGISVAIAILAMAFSEYLIVRHFIVEALREEGYTGGARLLIPVGDMLDVIAEGIRADPLVLLFWGIALFAAFTLPMRRRLRKVPV